jgi:hypothetical protein
VDEEEGDRLMIYMVATIKGMNIAGVWIARRGEEEVLISIWLL